MKKKLYDILGVKETASKEEIKRAYKHKIKKAHPDAGGNHEEFIKLSSAFRTLFDDKKRLAYDTTGEEDKVITAYENPTKSKEIG